MAVGTIVTPKTTLRPLPVETHLLRGSNCNHWGRRGRTRQFNCQLTGLREALDLINESCQGGDRRITNFVKNLLHRRAVDSDHKVHLHHEAPYNLKHFF